MRVLTWNMNKRKKGNWEWIINNFSPDYMLVQEASPLPKGVFATTRITTKKLNISAFYSKNRNHKRLKMSKDYGMGLLVIKSKNIFFINVYANLDFKPMYLSLLGLLSTYILDIRKRHDAKHILIAGDFNMDRRMDDNPTGTRFTAKDTFPINNFFDSILGMGFYDCMRKFDSKPIQTYRHSFSKYPWELDHMFVTKELYESLDKIKLLNAPNLSDHDPILADFKI